MIHSQRRTIGQEWSVFALTVPTTPIQVSATLNISSLVTTIIFSVPGSAANSVFLGNNAGVTITSGLEIPAGIPQQYRINNERELVEVESPLLDLFVALTCRNNVAAEVPLVTWDITQMYLVATANTAISIGIFKEMQV